MGTNSFIMIKNSFFIFDKTFIRFIIVGVFNTIVGTAIMLLLYNIFHFGYWFSSATNYILVSLMSFFLNKNYTFKYRGNGWVSFIRFFLNIAICYFIAFAIAKPFFSLVINSIGLVLSISWVENISMLLGSCFFVILNYLGQRFFAFR